MLAVGRALVGNPRILLLDEPFEGLAPVIIDTLAAALVRLRRESRIATLLVEQQVDIALELTERTIVLDKGQVVWRGDSAALAADRDMLAALVGLQEAPGAMSRAARPSRARRVIARRRPCRSPRRRRPPSRCPSASPGPPCRRR